MAHASRAARSKHGVPQGLDFVCLKSIGYLETQAEIGHFFSTIRN